MLLFRLLLVLLLGLALPVAAQVEPLPAPSPLDAPPKDAIETATGIHYKVLEPAPAPVTHVRGDFIEFTANVWSADGETRINGKQSGKILGSMRRLATAQPAMVRIVKSTPVGETRRWWVDAERMKPGYPGMPDLPHVFDITVHGEKDPTRAPVDVAAPPADAIRTASGLAYKVLDRGNRAPGHPAATDHVMVHYTGWTTAGQVFDSSLFKDKPATFPLQGLIQGWREGIRLMQRGDSFRFWIPGHLAYDNVPGADTPKGMLVFDVTLLAFGPMGPARPPLQADGSETGAADASAQ
ncbi:MAG TPA: FKBP-type peptidyl-prolyl cis-trans isomerase [Arenimonas sp.]|nr:FKBP-type peptidyl-prolyl cis-trans isomerase [Arenimonas sp.]